MNIYNKLQERRAEILAITAKHGAYNVRIFGSVARHEADLASDLDLLVEMEPERSILDLGGLLMDQFPKTSSCSPKSTITMRLLS